ATGLGVCWVAGDKVPSRSSILGCGRAVQTSITSFTSLKQEAYQAVHEGHLTILYDIYCLMLLAPDPGVVGQLLFFRNRFALSIWLARRLNSGTNHHRHRREP